MSNKNDWDSYDDSEDIVENEGGVPKWFNILFAITVVIAVGYAFAYHFIFDWSQSKEYAQDVKFQKAVRPVKTVKLTAEGKNPLRGNAEAITKGEKLFKSRCGVCHKADGTGLIGPNIVDSKWLHGNTDEDLYTLVMEGITIKQVKQNPPKGPMPPHKASVGSTGVLQILAYLAKINKSIK
jgi:cytochrome c oxidase cbb3-type subunit 3